MVLHLCSYALRVLGRSRSSLGLALPAPATTLLLPRRCSLHLTILLQFQTHVTIIRLNPASTSWLLAN